MFSTFQDIICFSFRTWAFLLAGKQTEDHKRAAHASRPADDARGGRSNNSRDPGLLDWGNTTNGRDGRRRFVWLSALPRRSHSIKKKKSTPTRTGGYCISGGWLIRRSRWSLALFVANRIPKQTALLSVPTTPWSELYASSQAGRIDRTANKKSTQQQLLHPIIYWISRSVIRLHVWDDQENWMAINQGMKWWPSIGWLCCTSFWFIPDIIVLL